MIAVDEHVDAWHLHMLHVHGPERLGDSGEVLAAHEQVDILRRPYRIRISR
jgi:hypothetical protein